MVELTQLKYFNAVAYYESITKAADALRISQPTMSKTIKLLEHNVGIPLFERDGRSVRLNSSGKAFLAFTENILRDLDTATAEAIKAAGQPPQVSVASTSQTFTPMLEMFFERNTDVRVFYRLCSVHSASRMLMRGEVSFIYSTLPVLDDSIEWIPINTSRVFVLMPDTNPLALKKKISLSELKNERFLFGDYGSDMLLLCNRFCALAGFAPNIIYNGYMPDHFAADAIIKGNLIRFITEGVAAVKIKEASKGISFVSITEPECTITTGIAIRKGYRLPEPAQELFEYIKHRLMYRQEEETIINDYFNN